MEVAIRPPKSPATQAHGSERTFAKMATRFVVLDLDSTLIFARPMDMTTPFREDERNFYVKPLSLEIIYHVTIRKHVTHFLRELTRRKYRIIVWSAAFPAYVKDIVSVLLAMSSELGEPEPHVEYLLTKNELLEDLKDLRVISDFVPDFDISQARLIDDNPDHSVGQEKSFLLIQPFDPNGPIPTAQEDDDVLATLIEELDKSYE